MRLVKIAALLAFSISLVTPIQADAQFGKVRDRLKDRAKERMAKRAEDEAGKRLDRAVDKGFDKAVESVDNMVAAALSKGSADVDLDNNVIRQQGQEDIELRENETSPADAEYVHYLQVTKLDLPGALGKFVGNGSYERIYLHGNQQLTRSSTSGALLDLDKEHMVSMNYADGTYFIQPFADLGAMLDMAVDPTTMGQPGQMPANDDQPEVDMEFDFEVRKGTSGMKRGSWADQSFIIVKTKFEAESEDEETETMKGTVYSITETWTTTQLAGMQSMTDFGLRAAELMGAALGASEKGGGLQTAMLSDPRIGAAMEEASRKMSEIEGYPVQSEMFVVLVPEGKELDLDRVLAKEMTDPSAAAGAGTASEEQVTMFSSMTFVSNLSTEPFDLEILRVPADMEQTKSPLEMIKEAQSGNGR